MLSVSGECGCWSHVYHGVVGHMICYGVVVAAVLARVALVQALHSKVIGLRYTLLQCTGVAIFGLERLTK